MAGLGLGFDMPSVYFLEGGGGMIISFINSRTRKPLFFFFLGRGGDELDPLISS